MQQKQNKKFLEFYSIFCCYTQDTSGKRLRERDLFASVPDQL